MFPWTLSSSIVNHAFSLCVELFTVFIEVLSRRAMSNAKGNKRV